MCTTLTTKTNKKQQSQQQSFCPPPCLKFMGCPTQEPVVNNDLAFMSNFLTGILVFVIIPIAHEGSFNIKCI